MATILDTIVDEKKREVALLKAQKSRDRKRSDTQRPFISALKDKSPLMAVIAEVKKASPSKGIIRADFDPLKIATMYQNGGAAAISVLTDEKFFMGREQYLRSIREKVELPLLRKDFIIDPLQVEQTAAMNADAMLLIAAILDDIQLRDLYEAAIDLELDPLIEIHSLVELDRVMKIGPGLIGINNRDLNTFVTDIAVSLEIVRKIPENVIAVAESGIENSAQAKKLKGAGIRALLIGETLMKHDNPEELLKEFFCQQ
jgi:indole-3-glycerol phosphate synthase